MSGADIHTLALILGHKRLRMAARYKHLSAAFLSDTVKLLDSAFAERTERACGRFTGIGPERNRFRFYRYRSVIGSN
jgi:hypothetical protein